jgi:predicted PurR-regulated permease PerM
MKSQAIITTAMGLALAYLTFLVIEPFATPLIFAIVMVLVFEPLHVRLERRFGRTAGAALGTASVVLLTLVPLFLLAGQVVGEAVGLAHGLDSAPFQRLLSLAQSTAARFGINVESIVRQGAQQFLGDIGALASRAVRDAGGAVIGTAIAMFATFFLFRDGREIVTRLPALMPMERAKAQVLLREIREMIQSNIAATLAAAALQGTIGGITFAILGLPAATMWGVVMALFSFVPVLGAWVVWLPAAAGLALAGRPVAGAVLVAVGLGIVGTVDNIVRPMLLAHATRMNGLLVMISLLGGVQAFGIVGLLLGPLVVSVVLALLAMYVREEPEAPTEPPPAQKPPPADG